MKIKFAYLTCFFLSFSAAINAQISNDAIDNRTGFAYSNLISKAGKSNKTNALSLKDIAGNPYTNKDFLPGKILFKNEKVDKLFLLRYNANKDLIEVKVEKDVIDNVLMSGKISCLIGDDLYIYTTYKDLKSNEEKTGYIKILYKSDDFVLFAKQKKTFYAEKISVDPLVPSHKAKFVGSQKLYVLDNANNTAYLLKKRKNFLALIKSSTLKKSIKKFMKKEGISFKKEKDLIRLLKHYNKIK
ncbi:MAG: hypothetical protein P8K77_06335 [Polaribacter sp.]|nr:hypothetical protein [Polaribacter sp.]